MIYIGVAVVQTPVSLRLDPELTAAAKVLWLALRRHSHPAMPTRLAASTRLTLSTIRNSLAQLQAAGWYAASTGAVERAPSPATVSIPASLLAERWVRPQAKLLYGILQTVPAFRDRAGEFIYASLSRRVTAPHGQGSILRIRMHINGR